VCTREFRLFGADHIAILGLLSLLSAAILHYGRRSGPGPQLWIGRILAIVLLSYAVAMYARLAYQDLLDPAYALPLELCHWVLIACLVSLFFRNSLASEIAYFWGLGGTLQAVLTPDLQQGFPAWDFLQFFWAHGGILLAIIYLVGVRRFRPRPGSVLRMMIAANVYLVTAGAADLAFGWNYGYLRHPPSQPSLLDHLGPWPWYILSLEAVAFSMFWLLALPWRKRQPSPHGTKRGDADVANPRVTVIDGE